MTNQTPCCVLCKYLTPPLTFRLKSNPIPPIALYTIPLSKYDDHDRHISGGVRCTRKKAFPFLTLVIITPKQNFPTNTNV